MDKERGLSRRRFITTSSAAFAASGLSELNNQNPQTKDDEGGLAGGLITLAIMGFGLYVMTGGLRRKKTPDDEIRDLKRRINDLERRNRR